MAYDYSIDDPAKNSKRTLAFVLVVIIHVLFFWVLASGLGAKVVEVVMGPVETKIIDEKPDEDKPPPPPPEIDTPPPFVPPPEVSIEDRHGHRADDRHHQRHLRAPGRAGRAGRAEAGGAHGSAYAAVDAGQGRAHHPAGVSAGVASCRRGGHA